ncbi:MAG: hypothetical protein IPJ24_05620 [bacterium]|nr:hypothetical protein [bacterium]
MTSTAAPRSMDAFSGRGSGERRVLLAAFIASLVLHLAGVLVLKRVPVDLSSPRREPAESSVEIALEPDKPAAEAVTEAETEAERQERERERIFTSIPERLASDTPPEDDPSQPQYLAMYHSLAANPTLGADALQPSAPRAAESPQVALQREDLENAAGVNLAAQAAEQPERPREQMTPAEAAEAARRERAERAQELKRSQSLAADERGALPVPRDEETQAAPAREERPEAAATPMQDWWGTTAPSVLRRADRGAPGDRGIDYDQDASGPQTSGVARVGDFSLNTWEWNYAPWMQAFGNTLMRNWVVPEGRKLGLIWGKTVMRVIVEKNGQVSLAEILETDGHSSLHNASRAALLSSSPFAPLPSHFPLAHLEIRLTMSYPEPPR